MKTKFEVGIQYRCGAPFFVL